MDYTNSHMALPPIPSSSLETLYSEFTRRRPTSSQSWTTTLYEQDGLDRARQQLIRDIQRMPCPEPSLDLRALDYVSDYEPHLMCPICHIPLINPIALECEHCFCTTCFVQSCDRVNAEEGPKCPSCRTAIRAVPRKAPRLILNMCDDIKVRCPNDGCDQILSRGHVEHHAKRQCPEQNLKCPEYPNCEQYTKRKHLVLGECRHRTHIECDCGAEIGVGADNWRKHKNEQCPNAGEKCGNCRKRVPDEFYLVGTTHKCENPRQECPGEEYGCGGCGKHDSLDDHIGKCTIGKLAPTLKAQATLLAEVRSELDWTKSRNEVLESTLDRMNELVHSNVSARTSDLHDREPPEDWFSSVIATSASTSNHAPLELDSDMRIVSRHSIDSAAQPPGEPNSQQHLLALHESLRASFATLQADVSSLSNNLAEVDARTSMHIMNETLRIKEDLAHTNAALFSTKAQVHWLLNRERAGQQLGVRGRAPGPPSSSSVAGPSSQPAASVSAAPMARGLSSEGSGGEQTVEDILARRPTRRPSGGSQERVKL